LFVIHYYIYSFFYQCELNVGAPDTWHRLLLLVILFIVGYWLLVIFRIIAN